MDFYHTIDDDSFKRFRPTTLRLGCREDRYSISTRFTTGTLEVKRNDSKQDQHTTDLPLVSMSVQTRSQAYLRAGTTQEEGTPDRAEISVNPLGVDNTGEPMTTNEQQEDLGTERSDSSEDGLGKGSDRHLSAISPHSDAPAPHPQELQERQPSATGPDILEMFKTLQKSAEQQSAELRQMHERLSDIEESRSLRSTIRERTARFSKESNSQAGRQQSTEFHRAETADTVTKAPEVRVKEPTMGTPQKYRGDRDKLGAYLAIMKNTFKMQPRTYATDDQKVAYMISNLEGKALDWATLFASMEDEDQPEWMRSYPLFETQIRKEFGDPDAKATMRNKIAIIKQTGTISELWVEFLKASVIVKYDQEALKHYWIQALKPKIKHMLALSITPTPTVDDLKDVCLTIESRMIEFGLNDSPLFGGTSHKAKNGADVKEPGNPKNSGNLTNTAKAEPGTTGGKVSSDPPPKRNEISEEEKTRRRNNNLCFECGEDGHRGRDCPQRRKNQEKQDNQRSGSTESKN